MTQRKLLLTSAGITNEHIRKALVGLLGKPINQSTALFVPTAIYAYPNGSNYAWRSAVMDGLQSLGNLGWKKFGILELTALPSLNKDIWHACDKTMHLVDFVIRPHLNSSFVPKVTLENIEKWAAKIDVPLYAIDDQTALKVIDGKVEVITEGKWKLFEKSGKAINKSV